MSDDTVRRWLDDGLVTRVDSGENSGPLRIDGASVAALINSQPDVHQLALGQGTQSVRNHLQGLVIAVHSDPVMSQVDLQCGPYRVRSLVRPRASASWESKWVPSLWHKLRQQTSLFRYQMEETCEALQGNRRGSRG